MKVTGVHKKENKKKMDENRDKVIKLAEFGCTDREIAAIVDVTEDMLKRYMRKEIDCGRDKMRGGIRKAQLRAAIEDKNPTMLIWMGKCYLGQREPKKELEHSGDLTIEKVMFNSNDKKNSDS